MKQDAELEEGNLRQDDSRQQVSVRHVSWNIQGFSLMDAFTAVRLFSAQVHLEWFIWTVSDVSTQWIPSPNPIQVLHVAWCCRRRILMG